MAYKLSYETELDVVSFRLKNSLKDTAEKFNISKPTVIAIMGRHEDVVVKVKEAMQAAAVAKVLAGQEGA